MGDLLEDRACLCQDGCFGKQNEALFTRLDAPLPSFTF